MADSDQKIHEVNVLLVIFCLHGSWFFTLFLCVDNSVSGPQDQLIRGNGNGLGILKFASYLNQFVSEKVGYCLLGAFVICLHLFD